MSWIGFELTAYETQAAVVRWAVLEWTSVFSIRSVAPGLLLASFSVDGDTAAAVRDGLDRLWSVGAVAAWREWEEPEDPTERMPW